MKSKVVTKRLGLAGALFVGAMALSAPALGDTMLVGSTSSATGVDGLLVDGTLYDVMFVHNSYTNVYASTAPTFLGNSTGASDAGTALAAALNAHSVTNLTGAGAVSIALIPASFTAAGGPACLGLVGAPCFSGTDAFLAGGTWSSGPAVADAGLIFNVADQAVFTAETPLPAALPLFAGGLGALGLLGWRRKRKPHIAFQS